MKRLFFILLFTLTRLGSCSHTKPVEGGLYYTQNANGSYGVLKILKVEEVGVHVRIYSNQFDNPPKEINESLLYLAGRDHRPDESFGRGHLPITRKTFDELKPTFIQQSTVTDEELEGYRAWLAEGGDRYVRKR